MSRTASSPPSCHVMSCRVMSCHEMLSCHVLSLGAARSCPGLQLHHRVRTKAGGGLEERFQRERRPLCREDRSLGKACSNEAAPSSFGRGPRSAGGSLTGGAGNILDRPQDGIITVLPHGRGRLNRDQGSPMTPAFSGSSLRRPCATRQDCS